MPAIPHGLLHFHTILEGLPELSPAGCGAEGAGARQDECAAALGLHQARQLLKTAGAEHDGRQPSDGEGLKVHVEAP